jgi:hypothetical protein
MFLTKRLTLCFTSANFRSTGRPMKLKAGQFHTYKTLPKIKKTATSMSLGDECHTDQPRIRSLSHFGDYRHRGYASNLRFIGRMEV